jgi:hypothetical protein
VQAYVGAWSDDRGRCHCFVYDSSGKPANCPEPTVTSGWLQHYQGCGFVLDGTGRPHVFEGAAFSIPMFVAARRVTPPFNGAVVTVLPT